MTTPDTHTAKDTIDDTLLWREAWRAAYWELERQWQAHYAALSAKALDLETRALIAECEPVIAWHASVEMQLAAEADRAD